MNSDLLAFDQKHIWHPYTSTTKPLPAYLVKSASGVFLELDNGKRIIDGMSSWWCMIHGYNHPTINQAIKDQIDQMSHVMFGGLTHTPAITLAQKLLAITPDSLKHIFFADSGSVAVEVAMKMALQYWAPQNKQKTKFLTVRKGYHGDTTGAMSVCDPINGMHSLFSQYLPKQIFVDEPKIAFQQEWQENDIEPMRIAIEENHENIAAVIIEPIVQGAGGMRIYHPQYLKELRALCNQYDLLLICDEIATGFGRTGKLFACQHADIEPDIMCIGKALTGGYMTMAAVLCSAKVANNICQDEHVFMHGPTFMANPLACAAAIASLDLLLNSDWQKKIAEIEKMLKEELEKCRQFEIVKDVRIIGAIGVVELNCKVNVARLQKFFVEEGVWIRPFNNLIYIMPPYIIQKAELEKICQVIYLSLAKKQY